MKATKINKNMTYDEIGTVMNISPQQVHKIEKEAFNKMFMRLNACGTFTPVEIVLSLCDYFGIQPDQCLKKMDKPSKEVLFVYVQEQYGSKVPGFTKSKIDVESIEELFKR